MGGRGGGVTLPNGLPGWLCTFFRISQVKAYERVGKSVSYLKGPLINVF